MRTTPEQPDKQLAINLMDREEWHERCTVNVAAEPSKCDFHAECQIEVNFRSQETIAACIALHCVFK